MTVDASWATKPSFYEAPCPILMRPRDYQQAGVEYALARDNVIFGDAPGLGKTAQCILTSNAINARKNLVVCPASLRLNWEREIWNWSTIICVKTHCIMKARDGVPPWAHYVIVSYDLLRNADLLEALLGIEWDHLILDEGHYLKDPKGNKRIKPICAEDGLRKSTGRISLATGTLLPNQPIECYNAIRLLDWSAIDYASLEDFRDNYYDYGEGFVTQYDPLAKKYVKKHSKMVRNVPRNVDDLRYRLRSKLMVRRTKDMVLQELPERQWHLFPLEQNMDIKKALLHEGWEKASEMHELTEGEFDGSVPIDGAISTARRLLGEAKAPAMADYILELLEEGIEKIVVGAWHTSVLTLLRDRIGRKYSLSYMDGSTNPRDKQEAVDQFQNGDARVILGQMIPLSKGWTLTEAQDAVLCEPYWVPGENEQFLDRIHRIGQEGSSVTGHVPVVPETLDERIIATVIQKGQVIQQALDGPKEGW